MKTDKEQMCEIIGEQWIKQLEYKGIFPKGTHKTWRINFEEDDNK